MQANWQTERMGSGEFFFVLPKVVAPGSRG